MQQLKPSEISELIKARIQNFTAATEARSVGTVVTVTDGICRIHGLSDAMQGEMLEFPAGRDGQPSRALLLFNHADVFTQERLIQANHPPETLFVDLWNVLRPMEVYEQHRDLEQLRGLLGHTTRPTSVKTRIVAHKQQVVRIDRERRDGRRRSTVGRGARNAAAGRRRAGRGALGRAGAPPGADRLRGQRLRPGRRLRRVPRDRRRGGCRPSGGHGTLRRPGVLTREGSKNSSMDTVR